MKVFIVIFDEKKECCVIRSFNKAQIKEIKPSINANDLDINAFLKHKLKFKPLADIEYKFSCKLPVYDINGNSNNLNAYLGRDKNTETTAQYLKRESKQIQQIIKRK